MASKKESLLKVIVKPHKRDGSISLSCPPMAEGSSRRPLSRIQLQKSPFLMRQCPESDGYGYDVHLTGPVITIYILERILDLFYDHSPNEIIHFIMNSNTCRPTVLWEFALVLDQLDMMDAFVEVREYLLKTIRTTKPSELRAIFNLEDDFTNEERTMIAHEERIHLQFVANSQLNTSIDDSEHMSVSIISDSSSLSSSKLHDSSKNKESARKAITAKVQPIGQRDPIPISAIKYCCNPGCNKDLTDYWLFRTQRYNCHLCGRVFCSTCAPTSAPVVQEQTQTSYLGLFNWFTQDSTPRVCTLCLAYQVDDARGIMILSKALFALGIDPISLQRVAFVCKLWRAAALNCLTRVRQMQYYSPIQRLSKHERRYLVLNRDLWAGHHGYLFQLAKAADWANSQRADEVLALLASTQRIVDCQNLLCVRECGSGPLQRMTDAHALAYLSKSFKNKELRRRAVERLRECKDEEIECFLPLLVHNIRHEVVLIQQSPLVAFLLERARNNVRLRVYLYCLLTTWASAEQDPAKSIYDVVRLELIRDTALSSAKTCDSEALINLGNFMWLCQSYPRNGTPEQKEAACLQMEELLSTNNVPFIVDPTKKLKKFDLRKIKQESSATAPFTVPYQVECPDGSIEEGRVMFKKDDVRKDFIIMCLIRLAAHLLKDSAPELSQSIVTYNVIPVSPSSGFVQFVPNSETVQKIIKQETFIERWVDYHNPNAEVWPLRERFTRSVGVYSVLAFMLGVGDRHLENLMVRSDGVFFHIDYGYVLGQEPQVLHKAMMPVVTLNQEMIQAMGNCYPEVFKTTVRQTYTKLRRHINLFESILVLFEEVRPPLTNAAITANDINMFLRQRWRPTQDEADATKYINGVLEECVDAKGGAIMNWFHGIASKFREKFQQ